MMVKDTTSSTNVNPLWLALWLSLRMADLYPSILDSNPYGISLPYFMLTVSLGLPEPTI